MGSDSLGIAFSAPSLVGSGTQREVALEVLQGILRGRELKEPEGG